MPVWCTLKKTSYIGSEQVESSTSMKFRTSLTISRHKCVGYSCYMQLFKSCFHSYLPNFVPFRVQVSSFSCDDSSQIVLYFIPIPSLRPSVTLVDCGHTVRPLEIMLVSLESSKFQFYKIKFDPYSILVTPRPTPPSLGSNREW